MVLIVPNFKINFCDVCLQFASDSADVRAEALRRGDQGGPGHREKLPGGKHQGAGGGGTEPHPVHQQ